MDNTALLNRAFDALKREGARGVATRMVAKIAAVRTNVLLQCDLSARIRHASAPGLQFSWATMDELACCKSLDLLSTDATRQTAQTRLTRGDRCLVGTFEGSPATYLWVTTSVRELPGLALPVGPGSVFVYKTFTLSDWRGRGLNRAAVSWALEEYRREGYCTAFVDVDGANHASLRALRSVGFRDVAQFRVWKLGPLAFTRMSNDVYCRVAGATRRAQADRLLSRESQDRTTEPRGEESSCPR